MWKLVVGFLVFAGLAMFVLMRGGDIDMGGEKHTVDAAHSESAASAPAPAAAASAAK